MEKFDNENKFSKKYELLLADKFKKKGHKIELAPDEKWLDWDILVDGIGIEVKADKANASLSLYPNIVIEWTSFNKPSGIQASKAKWYVYFYTRRSHDCWGKISEKNIETYKVDVALLKKYIDIPLIKKRLRNFPNTDGNTCGYLIPINDLVNKNIATKINVL
jgi:hypothetical protein